MVKKKNRMKGIIIIIVLLAIITPLLFTFGVISITQRDYKINNAFPNLNFDSLTGLYNADDGTNRLFAVEQSGTIKVFENSESTESSTIFLDISSSIITGTEEGLLGLAFHPNFKINNFFYVYYTAPDSLRSVISRWTVESLNHNKADTSSEKIILEVNQPDRNHKAGQLAFGPDGFLYIGLGDGGGIGDPYRNAQDRTTLLGSILRINIDSGDPYSIPTDNPYVDNTESFKEEIYAFGFRNPWKFSFDGENLWAADVGQQAFEEVNLVTKGGNYGWSNKEGSNSYLGGANNVTNTIDPIQTYNHLEGFAIIGGYVYHGDNLPTLNGKYIYGDYLSGWIWSIDNQLNNRIVINSKLTITSFGVDENGELLICSSDGNIYELQLI